MSGSRASAWGLAGLMALFTLGNCSSQESNGGGHAGATAHAAAGEASGGALAGAGAPSLAVVAARVGSEGAQVRSADGALRIDFPERAVLEPLEVSVRVVDAVEGSTGTVYELLPHGVQFFAPLRLTFALPSDAPDADALRVVTAADAQGEWMDLPLVSSDPERRTLSASISHFSYVAVLPRRPCEHDGECSVPAQCVGGVCDFPCREDAECPLPFACTRGRCRQRTCEAVADCPGAGAGYVPKCEQGLCAPSCRGSQPSCRALGWACGCAHHDCDINVQYTCVTDGCRGDLPGFIPPDPVFECTGATDTCYEHEMCLGLSVGCSCEQEDCPCTSGGPSGAGGATGGGGSNGVGTGGSAGPAPVEETALCEVVGQPLVFGSPMVTMLCDNCRSNNTLAAFDVAIPFSGALPLPATIKVEQTLTIFGDATLTTAATELMPDDLVECQTRTIHLEWWDQSRAKSVYESGAISTIRAAYWTETELASATAQRSWPWYPANCASACPERSYCLDGACCNVFNSCGACGNLCAEGTRCQSGKCYPIQCAPGLALCGNDCADLTRTREHCGSCSINCGEHATCLNSACCSVVNSCGTCGNVCAVGSTCSGGGCQPITCSAGLTLCGNSCVDLKGSPQNCGACGVSCGEQKQCLSGSCQDL